MLRQPPLIFGAGLMFWRTILVFRPVDLVARGCEYSPASIIDKCAGAVDVTDGARLESREGR